MANKLLVITRNSIPYVKEIREKCGSVTACILMQQLEYWFDKNPNGFFKFLSPCDNKKYIKGDSWCEELGFSEDEFRTAFGKIGISHKSKNMFEKDEDSFKNMFYCSYFDKIKGLTFYFRNDELVDKYLNSIVVLNSQKPLTEIKVAKTRKPTKAIYVNGQSPFTETDNPRLHTYSTENTTENTTENKADFINSEAKKEFQTEHAIPPIEIEPINPSKEILEYLNTVAGRNFDTESTANVKFINARLKKYSVQDLLDVIEWKTRQWQNSETMKMYIRPETLFNETKFQSYYQEVQLVKQGKIKINESVNNNQKGNRLTSRVDEYINSFAQKPINLDDRSREICESLKQQFANNP